LKLDPLLTNISYKFVTGILSKRVVKFLEQNKIIEEKLDLPRTCEILQMEEYLIGYIYTPISMVSSQEKRNVCSY